MFYWINVKSIVVNIFRPTHTIVTLFLVLSLAGTVLADTDETINLSQDEREWLAKHPVIRLASDIAWPPFEWVDDQGQYQGIAADYMALIEKKLGIRFEVEKNKAWPEVVQAVKDFQLDVFSCVAKNEQREEFVNFTRPYLSFPMVIVTTNEFSYIDGMNDLKDLTVSVVDGYATHDYLVTNHPEIKLHIVKSSEQGLDAVSHGITNAFVDNIAAVTTIIQARGLTNLKLSGEMPIRYELAMAVRKDWPLLIELLQRALDSIKDEQRKQIHNKWIHIRYEHGIDYTLFWKSFALFSLVIALLYFYNRKLSREIKHRIKAEESAMIARDEADKANQAKSEFLSVMSHELRTPLTSIKGAIGLLASGKIVDMPEKALNMLRIAGDNSERLSGLINDILDIEKMLAGKMQFEKNTIVIDDLIRNAVAANQGYAEIYGITFAVETNSCASLTITADEHRLMQVLSNLISNAIKYSPKNGTVRLSAKCTEGKVRINVIDNGKGIAVEFKEQIFNYFSQADSSDSREKGGTGLGLAISKEIIDRHEGEIGFISKPGEGATFYFELAVNQEQLPT